MAGYINTGRLMYFSKALTDNGTLNFLVVSSSQSYLEQIGSDLYLTQEVQRDKRNYSLKVHTAKTLADVIEYMPEDFYVDFVVLILRAGLTNCLDEVEYNLSLIDTNFPRERICLVNPESSFTASAISPPTIWEFARHHQLNLINAQIKKPDGMFTLSKRILNLGESCCGLLQEIPLVNVV